MKRLLIIMLGLLLVSCRAVKSSTETAIKAETAITTDLAISTELEKVRVQRMLEEMFVKHIGYKDITIYDTSLAQKTDKGYEAPISARVVIRDTVVTEGTRTALDTMHVTVYDTIRIKRDERVNAEVYHSQKENRKPPYDGFLSIVILAVIVIVIYKICRYIE